MRSGLSKKAAEGGKVGRVVSWALRAGGLGGEMGLHPGGILDKFRHWNLLVTLATVAKCGLFHS